MKITNEERLYLSLKEMMPRCNICGEYATWSWDDEDGIEFRCDKHKELHPFYKYGPNEVIGAYNAIKAIERHEATKRELNIEWRVRVSGCEDCPFCARVQCGSAAMFACTAALHSHSVASRILTYQEAQSVKHNNAPDWCPLREKDITIRLNNEY